MGNKNQPPAQGNKAPAQGSKPNPPAQGGTPPATGAATGAAPAETATRTRSAISPLKHVTGLLNKVVKAAQAAKVEHPAIAEAAEFLKSAIGSQLEPIETELKQLGALVKALDIMQPGAAEKLSDATKKIGQLQKKRAALTGE